MKSVLRRLLRRRKEVMPNLEHQHEELPCEEVTCRYQPTDEREKRELHQGYHEESRRLERLLYQAEIKIRPKPADH
jgi:hypothetical protein